MNPERKIKNCVGQCRASSLKQSQEGETLDNQEKSIRSFILNKGWNIVPDGKIWSTTISGRKTFRDDFQEILGYIKSHPSLVDYYVFKAIDRFTRAGVGEYERMKAELASCGVEMIDLQGIIQPTKNSLEEYNVEYGWSRYSPSEITENIFASNAKQEVTTILTRMIGQEIKLTRDGYRMRRPLDGFKNDRIYVDGKKKPIQIPNQNRAHFYISMFDMRIRGLTDKENVRKINALGFKSEKMNKWDKAHKQIIGHTGGLSMTVKQLQRAISNPVYAGVICEKWTNYLPIRAQYDGLVTIEKFNLANKGKFSIKENTDASLQFVYANPSKTGKTRLKNNPLFPYKFFLCPTCEKPFLGSVSKGKSGKGFPSYHCARNHKQFGVNKKEFEESVVNFTNNLKFKPELLNALELVFINKYRARQKEIVKASSCIHQSISDLQAEQAGKLDAIVATTSSIVREKLTQDVEALEEEIKTARKERFKIEVTEQDIKSVIREARKIMEHPSEILLNPTDISQQRELFELVFEKMPTYKEIVNGTPKLSWIFKLSSEFKPDENQLVSPLCLKWNTIESTILQWKQVFNFSGQEWVTA